MVRKIKAKLVLQLRAEGLSGRAIASSQAMSRKSVTQVLDAADAAGVSWDDVKDRPDGQVYSLLFPGRGDHHSVFAQPDWERIHKEMARVGVTLKLLHGEYVDACAGAGDPAMSYDRFCRTYQRHVLVTGAASRVGHKAAQTIEVDWSGPTMGTRVLNGQRSTADCTTPGNTGLDVQTTSENDTRIRTSAARGLTET